MMNTCVCDFQLELFESPKAEVKTVILPHYECPSCDNEKLLNMQYEYKVNGDRKSLTGMYTLGYTIAMKYIQLIAKKNIHIAELSHAQKCEKAHNAVTYMIARYLKFEDFAITDSFTSYLFLRVQHELFYQREVDKVVDFLDDEILSVQKSKKITPRPKPVKEEDKIQMQLTDTGERRVLIMYADGKTKEMAIEKACREYGITEAQIQNAIDTGHHLKTMLFDDSID